MADQPSRAPPARSRPAAGVRRNLFSNQHLTRRPTTSSTSSSSDTVSIIRAPGVEFEIPDTNIVERDKKGDIPIFDPIPLMDEEGGVVDEREEARRERERLSEMVRQMARSRGPGQDEEFLEALRLSLRAKVSALDEDNWRYEAEEPPRNQ